MRGSVDVSLAEQVQGIEFEKPLKACYEIKNRAGVVELSLDCKGEISALCDRCAAKVQKPFSLKTSHTLVKDPPENDDGDYIVIESALDLDGLILEDALLSLPSKILCKPDCKGLCAKCGKDLNEGKCECKKEIDPRWAALLGD